MYRGGRSSTITPRHEVSRMQYTLKLVKVGGMTRWGVHDGRKVISILFETYGQAVAERTKVEARDRLQTERAAG